MGVRLRQLPLIVLRRERLDDDISPSYRLKNQPRTMKSSTRAAAHDFFTTGPSARVGRIWVGVPVSMEGMYVIESVNGERKGE